MMTMTTSTGPQSMRYSVDEVLSGMLASITKDRFTADTARLGAAFKSLAAKHSLLAPFTAAKGEADFSQVLQNALKKLVDKKLITQEAGQYVLTPSGRASCVSSKRMLFKPGDMAQLEAAANDFEAHVAV